MKTLTPLLFGSPLPLGTNTTCEGTNFAVYSQSQNPVILHLYDQAGTLVLSEPLHRTGHIFHGLLKDVPSDWLYAYEVEGKTPILDPYAKETNTTNNWNDISRPYSPLGLVHTNTTAFDWENDLPPALPKEDLIIYEMHIRGFTKDATSQVNAPGTYQGMLEKISYLKELGVNAVELLPVFEFNEAEYDKINTESKKRLCNYWGYTTINFFSPVNRYASACEPSCAAMELKTLVRELHKNGIEVILDVVYNHSGEGNEQGPTFSFKGLANSTYYFLDDEGRYLNFSGCGNTLNCNHPITRQFIIDSLRYWVTEYHIDGFRFDLASVLTRGNGGFPLANPPLIEAITQDPILSNTKLIAEAWDAVGLYQIGCFYPQGNRWSEWNGIYRDVIRRFLKGIYGGKGDFATRLCGSSDLYHLQSPSASINFITCHDGFTLADLVSYNHKHNLENGENNQDGSSWNDSWNCGVEGPTEDANILKLRQRQMRNFHLALMVSQGIPMLHMGDEYGHTKLGNNNTWCQDNELNWFLWKKLEENKAFYDFYKFMISFRKNHPHFKHKNFLTDKEVEWHGVAPFNPIWEEQGSFLALRLFHEDSDLYIAFNASDNEVEVEIPSPNKKEWRLVINTADTSDLSINPAITGKIMLTSYCSLILKDSK